MDEMTACAPEELPWDGGLEQLKLCNTAWMVRNGWLAWTCPQLQMALVSWEQELAARCAWQRWGGGRLL